LSPRWYGPPDRASMVAGVSGRSAHEVPRPNGVIATTVILGCCSRSLNGNSEPWWPSWDRGDQTAASAEAMRVSVSSTSSGVDPSTTTLCFEQARNLKSAPSSSRGTSLWLADQRRRGSPESDSTLITSAPASASSFVQYAPEMPSEKSTMRRPSKGYMVKFVPRLTRLNASFASNWNVERWQTCPFSSHHLPKMRDNYFCEQHPMSSARTSRVGMRHQYFVKNHTFEKRAIQLVSTVSSDISHPLARIRSVFSGHPFGLCRDVRNGHTAAES
jgi:hypothetical protein